MDNNIYYQCRNDREIRQLKIKSLEYAIQSLEVIIAESHMDSEELVFLRRKVAESRQDLEILYLLLDEEELS